MGLERLLCGTLERYSSHFRFGYVPQKVRLFCNASMSAEASPSSSVSTRLVNGSERFGGVHPGSRGFCTSTQPSRDVTLFEHDRTKFFRLLSLFCGGQFIFWTYLAQFAFTGLKDTSGTKDNGRAKQPITTGLAGMWSFEMNLGSNAWSSGPKRSPNTWIFCFLIT
ncbi:transmembrane protein 223 isoform X3 [Nothobranchius furzeri]|uniref:transmembrane protein 223 isoform X3 n=1 Tax=Nothobranchius furzeri TaxID=105023 RepID=UPI002403D4DA|nr:transmembrane protein 223 isoform X3 [Nothobranchius furzeri]XP_054591703.1 transmembrane protein 223 isoform X3 [Nothobranchius furzeri]